MLFLLAIVGLPACNDEQPFAAESLKGVWDLTSAMRDGETTGTLNGVFYEFDGKMQMRTNLPLPGAGDGWVKFSLKNAEIIPVKSGMVKKYVIAEYAPETMTLAFDIQGSRFLVQLQKRK